eukprot:151118-Prymnesium_polylepis.1
MSANPGGSNQTAEEPPTLLSLPPELFRGIVVLLPSPEDVSRLSQACRLLHDEELVVEALRLRLGQDTLPLGEMASDEPSVAQWLLWCERRR